MRTYGASMIAAVVLCGATAHAEIANDKVKIGVLTDLSAFTRPAPATDRSRP